MIEFKPGTNIFDYTEADFLINPVNCVGVMGKGLAKQFKKRYPWEHDLYRVDCDYEKYKPGTLRWYPSGDSKPTMACGATKDHWTDSSMLIDIATLAENIARAYDKIDATVVIPKLGCGLGGLDWVDVRRILVDRLQWSTASTFILIGEE